MKSSKPFHKTEVKKMIATKEASKTPVVSAPHHSGKGTRARLNTAAEKTFFGSKFSK